MPLQDEIPQQFPRYIIIAGPQIDDDAVLATFNSYTEAVDWINKQNNPADLRIYLMLVT